LPALFCFVASLGFISPNSTALALQHQHARAGTASALMGTLQLSLAALASAAISFWQTGNELPLAAVMAASGCGALLMWRFAERSARNIGN